MYRTVYIFVLPFELEYMYLGLNPYMYGVRIHTYGIKLYKLSIYKVQEPKSKPLVMPVEMAILGERREFFTFFFFSFLHNYVLSTVMYSTYIYRREGPQLHRSLVILFAYVCMC